jgi:hypothetical protein
LSTIIPLFQKKWVCVGYLGGKLAWIPRSPAERGNKESSPRKRRIPRSSRRAAGGCGATGGPRCHGWPRCHALQGWQRGPDRPGQTAPEQRACPGRFPVRRASKDGTRSLVPMLRVGTRNLPKEKTYTQKKSARQLRTTAATTGQSGCCAWPTAPCCHRARRPGQPPAPCRRYACRAGR